MAIIIGNYRIIAHQRAARAWRKWHKRIVAKLKRQHGENGGEAKENSSGAIISASDNISTYRISSYTISTAA